MQFNASIIALAAAIIAGTVSATPAALFARTEPTCPTFEGTISLGDCHSGKVAFDLFRETDFPGNDLPTTPPGPVQDFNACLRLCAENNWKNLPSGKCIGVTFNHGNKRCFLKNKIEGCGHHFNVAQTGRIVCHNWKW